MAAAIESDYAAAGLEPRRLEMLRFVDRLTRVPGAVTRSDAERLRGVDFSDRDILDIVEVAAYYAYANRVADGLGIELEEPDAG